MDKQIKVLIADMSLDFQILLRDTLEQQTDLTVVGAFGTGEEAYRVLRKQPVDVLLTDLLLPGMDGLSLLRQLRNEGRMPPTIVLSGFITPWTMKATSELGVVYYLAKPCSAAVIAERIREAIQPGTPVIQQQPSDIYTFLNECGILYYVSGHRYLMEAIQQTLDNPSVLHGITKILYPDLAKLFHTTPMCVEHSIRRAVTAAWKRMDSEQRNRICGGIFAGTQRPPSNARFIAAAANHIRGEREKLRLDLQA